MSDYIRVKDKDTGYRRTIRADQVHLGNYQVLKQPTHDPVTGDVVAPETADDTTDSGKPAGENKEKS